jgi:hypothetical protein
MQGMNSRTNSNEHTPIPGFSLLFRKGENFSVFNSFAFVSSNRIFSISSLSFLPPTSSTAFYRRYGWIPTVAWIRLDSRHGAFSFVRFLYQSRATNGNDSSGGC